jgi:threonine dehydrogenase-like Zn-dependent dehydrogenase
VADGQLYLDEIITYRFAIKDYLEAYRTIDSSDGRYMKVMIEL